MIWLVNVNIEIHTPNAHKEDICDRARGLSLAGKITIHCIATNPTGFMNDPRPFIRVLSLSQELLDEVGRMLADFKYDIEFVKLAGFKSAHSTDIQR